MISDDVRYERERFQELLEDKVFEDHVRFMIYLYGRGELNFNPMFDTTYTMEYLCDYYWIDYLTSLRKKDKVRANTELWDRLTRG